MKRVPDAALLTRAGALLAAAFFLATSFRYGWTRAASDFPNYYTAAVLVRKAQPLKDYYDWTWFQRQMDYAGIRQLGAYVPQTPLAMLPFVAVSGFPVQTAKRIWLLFNLGFLAGTFWLLSRLTSFRMEEIALLAFLGYGALHFNFLYGQYYVCLLFLITGSLFCMTRARWSGSGFALSTAFALKLYGGPFLLYLCTKRRWKAVAAMMAGTLLWVALAIAIFGWSDIHYFAARVLPRALEGETIDPYNNLNGSLTTLLRRLFMAEPELNPHPLWNAPLIFFFAQPLLTLLILFMPFLAIVKSSDLKRDFAWFFVALLLASPNTGSYTFVLALLPIVLLMERSSLREKALLMLCYFLLAIPLRPAWSWFFPKFWLLLGLFLFAGWGYWHFIRPAWATGVACSIILLASVSASRHLASYLQEPGRHWEQIAVQPGAIFSSSPAVLRSGIFYQAIGRDRYVLRWFHDGRIEEFQFDGDALQPVAHSPDGPIQFELVAHGNSTNMLFDVNTKTLFPATASGFGGAALSMPSPQSCVLSPDKKWILFTQAVHGNKQIWLKNATGGQAVAITGGDCGSWSPVWDLDSKGIVFASDCSRGIGCPALYRARFSGGRITAFR